MSFVPSTTPRPGLAADSAASESRDAPISRWRSHASSPPRPMRRRFDEAPLFKPPGWVFLEFGEVGWWVRTEWREALLGPDGLRLEEWRDSNRTTTVKTGPHRVVYRVETAKGAVYVKHYKVPGLREILRQWFRRGKARNEAKRARKLARIGIPTITPIALGEQRRRAFLFENYLISPEIPGSRPLDQFVEEYLPTLPVAQQAKTRRALAREVALLTARLHDAGFLHQDFHPGNVLVRVLGPDQIELAMIDLDALRRPKRIDQSSVKTNLALLNHYFWFRCDRADRLRFLKCYLEARQRTMIAADLAEFAQSIEDATRAWAERLWRRWGRRCRESNKYFHVNSSANGRCVAVRDVEQSTMKRLLANPDAPFDQPDTVMIKSSRTTTVAEVTLEVGGRQERVIYKRFNKKKFMEPMLNMARPTRGWRAWQAGQHLTCRGIPTPRNLLCIERGRGHGIPVLARIPHTSYVVTTKAAPSQTLADFAREGLPLLNGAEQRGVRRSLCRALAKLIRSLHERSLSHRDLKAANILILGDPCAVLPELSLIDLVGADVSYPLPRRRIVQNLARLYLSMAETPGRTRSDYLRFLRAYLPWSRTPRAAWKVIWMEIVHAASSKHAQNQRRGRPLS